MNKQKPNGHAATADVLRWLHEQELSLNQALVLYETARMQEAGLSTRIGEVATALEMPFSTVSRLAWDLAERGLLEQRPVPGDRRARALVVTERLRRLD